MARVLVVGAGIAGLVGARVLEQGGHDVVVLDKGRRPGGRLATRRPAGPDGPVFDHGAQFVTLRSDELTAETRRWRDEGWLVEWFRGSPDLGAGSHDVVATRVGADGSDGHVRYRGAPYQRGLAEALAAELADVRCGVTVTALSYGDGWTARTADGPEVTADALLVTPPGPQTLALLDAGAVALEPGLRDRLDTVAYEPCWAVLAVPSDTVSLPTPGAVRLTDHDVLAFVADNRAKGVSDQPAVTIHATGDWTRAHLDDDPDAVGRALVDAARDLLGTDAEVVHTHRWRYSAPTTPYRDADGGEDPAPGGTRPGPIRFAGDAFSGGRVEGAALSGWTAAHRLATDLP